MRSITQEQLRQMADKHAAWLDDEPEGQRLELEVGTDLIAANLKGTDLIAANLKGTDISGADISGANLSCAKLNDADLHNAKLIGTNLKGAYLSGASLHGTDLSGANIDYASFALSCCLFDARIDRRIAAQLAYHFCRLQCDDTQVQALQQSMYPLANEFHRVTSGELPELHNEPHEQEESI